MAELILPTKPSPPKETNARVMLIYGPPKAGKTTVLAQLPNNLIVDMDPLGGTDYVECLSVPARHVDDLREIINALYDSSYDFITLDPITDLEKIVLPLACELYQKKPIAKNWRPIDPDDGKVDYSQILYLPQGAGYGVFWEAFMTIVMNFVKVCNATGAKLILSGHLRDKIINKQGKEVEVADVNLTGKLRNIVCGVVDAIGYFYRNGDEGRISFEATSNTSGSRARHIVGRDILLSKTREDGSVETFWEEIYLPDEVAA